MKIRVRLGSRSGSDAVLLRMAAFSAVGHAVLLVVFSVLPRFIAPSPPPRAIIAEVVPASVLLPQPAPSRPPQQGETPSQRAKAAREAAEEARTPPSEPVATKPEPKKEPIPPPPDEPEKKPAVEEKEPVPVPVEPEEMAPVEEMPGEDLIPSPEPDPGTIPSGPAPSAGAGISFGGATQGGIPSIGSSLFPYDYYRSSLVSILQSHWRRPVAPDGLPEMIQCRVQFTIIKSGIIQDPQIVSPSGNRALDQSALRAVYDSSPLPPLPYQYSGPSVRAEVIFELTPD